MAVQPVDFGLQFEATAAQMRRVLDLLDAAKNTSDLNTRFAIHVGALHLARSIPEYWYTVAEQIPIAANQTGNAARNATRQLRTGFEKVFRKARRYTLLSDLRHWDFHWEPLLNPLAFGRNVTYGRGGPVKIAVGPGPGSTVFMPGNRLYTSGSGRRVGRSNYYQIAQRRFVDPERSEALPFELAIRQFIEDLPECVIEISRSPEVIQYRSNR